MSRAGTQGQGPAGRGEAQSGTAFQECAVQVSLSNIGHSVQAALAAETRHCITELGLAVGMCPSSGFSEISQG